MSLEFGVKKDRKEASKTGQKAEKPTAVADDTESSPNNKSNEDEKPQVKSKSAVADADEGDEENHVNRSRQIVVFGVPIDVPKKVLKIVLSKASRKIEVDLIKEDHALSSAVSIVHPPGKVMLVTAASRQEASKVLALLSTTNINNLGFAKHIKDGPSYEEDPLMKALTATALAKNRLVARTLADVLEDQALRKRKCRVIIRNLSFQATEQNVIDKMGRFGPIAEVDLPQVTVQKKSVRPGRAAEVSRPRGFAFVTFLCPSDAQRAVSEGAELKICNRPVAVDFSMSKYAFTKFGGEDEAEGAEGAGEETSPAAGDEVVATGNEAGDDMEEEDEDEEDVDEEEGEDEDEDDDEDEEGDSMDEDDDAEDDEDEDEEDDDKGKSETKKKFGDDVHEGKTLFVRGLSFDSTAADIRRALGTYGKIELAVIVTDKLTGMSKGSAFVKYFKAEDAAKCLAATKEQGVTIKERPCKVDLAVDKSSVEKLKSKEVKAKDKRNLYLANEGLVLSEGAVLSTYDREKRERAQSEKKKKLLNPLFFVSATRLSIRNLAKNVSDVDLRTLCNAAAKKGLERGLVSSQDLNNALKAQGNAAHAIVADFQAKTQGGNNTLIAVPKPRKASVKTAKVMFDPSRMRDGKPQSRGYAFVEFVDHAHALACLRELNNNAAYLDKSISADGHEAVASNSKLIVEFSLENIRKVKILQERRARALEQKDAAPKDKEAATEQKAAADKPAHKPSNPAHTHVMSKKRNRVDEDAKAASNSKPQKKRRS